MTSQIKPSLTKIYQPEGRIQLKLTQHRLGMAIMQITDYHIKINKPETRPKKFAEGIVCMYEHADDVPLSTIQARAQSASLKC